MTEKELDEFKAFLERNRSYPLTQMALESIRYLQDQRNALLAIAMLENRPAAEKVLADSQQSILDIPVQSELPFEEIL